MEGMPYFIEEADVDSFGFDWGRVTVTTAPELNGAAALSTASVRINPGQGHDRHNHPGAEEIIYVVAGTGEQMVEDEAGQPIIRMVGPGTTIYVPASRFHATRNTGATPMHVFVVYTPAGAEQVLRTLPDFRLIPRGQ